MNRAEDLFKRIMKDPKAELEAMVRHRESEDTWLDFKAPDQGGGGWAKVQDLFSKAVAGFGNTDGGVIIWGITTKKRKNKYGEMVDAADGFSLIPDPIAISSSLDNDVSRVTFPAHPGVVNEPFPLWDDGSGVVMTYVPLCPHRPLQRALEGTKDFIMRAGDSFTHLPYQLLSGMFGRPPNAEIRTLASSVACYHSETGRAEDDFAGKPREQSLFLKITFVISVENCGSVPARDCYLSLRINYGENTHVWPDEEAVVESSTWQRRIRNNVIESGFFASLNNGAMLIPGEVDRLWVMPISIPLDDFEPLTLDFITGAESAVPHRLRWGFTAEQLGSIDRRLQEVGETSTGLSASLYSHE